MCCCLHVLLAICVPPALRAAAGGCQCTQNLGIRALSSVHSQSSNNQGGSSPKPSAWGMSVVAAAAAGMLMTTGGISLADAKRAAGVNAKVEQQQQDEHSKGTGADTSGKLPEYTADQVAQHKTPKDRVWVTYKDGVYDITDFIAQVRPTTLVADCCCSLQYAALLACFLPALCVVENSNTRQLQGCNQCHQHAIRTWLKRSCSTHDYHLPLQESCPAHTSSILAAPGHACVAWPHTPHMKDPTVV